MKNRDREMLKYIIEELDIRVSNDGYNGSRSSEDSEKIISEYAIETNLVDKYFFYDHWSKDKTFVIINLLYDLYKRHLHTHPENRD
tara:strand:+ start:2378 stop:2635 length:258 start_codon:yes stop_codon:yes gene_type:complete